MKNENQNSFVMYSYDEEKLKKIFSSIIQDSIATIINHRINPIKEEFDFITIPDSAKLINKSTRTLYNWIYSGKLKRYYINDSPYLKLAELNLLPEVKQSLNK